MRIRDEMIRRIYIIALVLALFGAGAVAAPNGYQDASLPLYREAFEKMMNGAFAEAVASFEALIAAFPESTRADDAAFNIAYCLEKLGDLPEAFRQYRNVLTEYKGSITARKAEKRAVDLARQLRTADNDQYAQFLETIFSRENAYFARITAMRMAEFGDWRGLDLLIESLDKGSVFEQIRSAELLARKAEVKKVNEALRHALVENRNPIVRVNALRGLQRHSNISEVREALINVLVNDSSELLRSVAARSLGRYIDSDPAVRAAFDKSIAHETHPMVLQPVISISLHSEKAEEIRARMLERLGNEQDPMVQFMLSSALGDELKHSENVGIVENLVNNPEPMVRINALRTLQPRAEEPEIKLLFVDKLKNDPDSHVRMIALNALKDDAASDGEVRQAVVTILRESDDATLLTTSIHAIQPHVDLPEMRDELISVLTRSDQPIVAGQAVYALLPELGRQDVREVVFDRLKQTTPLEIKYAVSHALISAPAENSAAIVAELKPLYLKEQNVRLAINYLRAIQRMDPKAAAELRKQRNIIGF